MNMGVDHAWHEKATTKVNDGCLLQYPGIYLGVGHNLLDTLSLNNDGHARFGRNPHAVEKRCAAIDDKLVLGWRAYRRCRCKTARYRRDYRDREAKQKTKLRSAHSRHCGTPAWENK